MVSSAGGLAPLMTSRSMGKLETRNQKLEIGKEKGVLSEGEAAARTGRVGQAPTQWIPPNLCTGTERGLKG